MKDDELICYFVVNSELNLSVAKVAVSVAHIMTLITYDEAAPTSKKLRIFHEWLNHNDQKKIILRGKQKDLERLIDQGFYYIRDKGYTEVQPNSLTCVGLPPMLKSEAQQYIKRLQLY